MTEPLTPNYDLSLNKILSGWNRTFLAGQQVTFTITVVNQSSVITAHQFTFDDIIPVGLTLSDPDWTLNGNRAVSNFSGNLVPGGSYNKDITFTVNGSVFGTLTNRAEITIDDGFDYDSTPHNWTWLDVEDDDDSDYIVVVKPNNPGGTYTPVPTPTPPQCIWDSCNPVSQTPIITVIKKLLTNIRDVIFPQVKKSTPVKIPRTWVDVD